MREALLLILVLSLLGCNRAPEVDDAPKAPDDAHKQADVVRMEASVKGAVRFDGEVPTPRKWFLDPEMQRATGKEFYREETWLVDENKGLANCVVTLKPKKAENPPRLKPVENAILDKADFGYVPRVLVVTSGTEVTLRNKASPCRGFTIQKKPRFGGALSYLVYEGKEVKAIFEGPDTCPVTCAGRSYMRGYIVVVETPYFAVTNAKGEFAIHAVPAGVYQVTIWHEGAGVLDGASGPTEMTVSDRDENSVNFRVTPPRAKEK